MKKNFLLNTDLIDIVNVLPKEDTADLFIAILNYANDKEYELKPTLLAVFIPIKKLIDSNNEKYQKVVERNRENGQKGGRPKKEKTTKKNPMVERETQNNPVGYSGNPKKPEEPHISYITNHNSLIINQEDNKRVVGEEEGTIDLLDNNQKIYHEVISYLNQVVGTSYRPTSKETQKHIKARLNEGFSVEDFKVVIDNMAHKWLKDEKMNRYLRPETLFGTKFESYLNEKPVIKPRTLDDISYEELDAMIEMVTEQENEEN